MASVDVRLTLGPYAAGDPRREMSATKVLMEAASAAGLLLSIDAGFNLIDPDGPVEGIVDVTFVRDNKHETGAVIGFPNAALAFFAAGDAQLARVEFYNEAGIINSSYSEGEDVHGALAQWLSHLARRRTTSLAEHPWQRTAEALLALVDRLVGDPDVLTAQLAAAHVDLDVARTRIKELELLRDLLLEELTRTKGATSRPVVRALASGVAAVLIAFAGSAGGTIATNHFDAPRLAADAVVQQCDAAADRLSRVGSPSSYERGSRT